MIKHAGWGTIVGGTATGIGGGIQGRRAKMLPKYDKAPKDFSKWSAARQKEWKESHLRQSVFTPKEVLKMDLGDKARWAFTGAPMQIVAESGVFAVGQTIDDVYFQGNDFRWRDFLNNWGQGAALFTGMRGQDALLKRGRNLIDKIKPYFKRKNNKSLQAYEELGKTFEESMINEIRSDAYKDRLKQIENSKTDASSKFDDISVRLNDITKKFDEIINVINKGKEYKDTYDVVGNIKFLEAELDGLSKEAKEVNYQENSIDAVKFGSLMEDLAGLEADVKGWSNNLDKSFRKHLTDKASIVELVEQLEIGHGVKRVFVGNKKIPIVNKDGEIQVSYDILAEELAKREKKKEGEVPFDSAKEMMSKALATYQTSGEKGRGVYERAEELSKLLDFDKLITSSGTKQKINYDRSSDIIKNMLQNFYPTAKAETGAAPGSPIRTGVVINPSTGEVKKQNKGIAQNIKHLNEFASYLANLAEPKNFSTMTADDIALYIGMKDGSKYAISHLVEHLRKLQAKPEYKNVQMHDASLAPLIERKMTTSLSIKVPTRAELTEQIGLKSKSLDLTHQDGPRIMRVVSKGQDIKITPISDMLKKSLNGVIAEREKQLGRKLQDDDVIFTTNKGKPLYVKDLDAIINELMGSKIQFDNKGKPSKTIARAMRKFLGEQASVKDFLEGTGGEQYAVIDRMGLGHGKAIELKEIKDDPALKGIYGAGEVTILDQYNKIKDKIYKDINKPKQGQGKKDEQRYTIKEVSDALKRIKKMKKDETLTLEITGNITSDAQIHREYSKNTLESILRTLIENPSRLNEIVLEDIGVTELRTENQKEINQNTKQFKKIKKIKQENDELDGSPKDINVIQQNIDNTKELVESRKEWLKSDPKRKEKIKVNNSIKWWENKLLKGKDISPLELKQIKRDIFKTVKYEVSPSYSISQYESYRDELKKISEEGMKKTDIEKYILEKFLPIEIAEEITISLGIKDGDFKKLGTTGRYMFMEFVDKYVPQNNLSSIFEQDLFNSQDNGYLHLIQGGRNPIGKTVGLIDELTVVKRASTHAWIILKNMEKKSTGNMKKYASNLYDFVNEYDYYFTSLHGKGNVLRDKLVKFIKDSGDPNAYKDNTWMRENAMREIIKEKDNLNLPEELRKLYQESYNNNISFYENSKIEGTWENEALLMAKEGFDARWAEANTVHKRVHKPIKGTLNYKEKRDYFKNLYVDGYMPQMASKNLNKSGKFSEFFEKKLERQVSKEIDKKIERELDKKKQFKDIKNKSLATKKRDANNNGTGYGDLYKDRLKLYEKDSQAYQEIVNKIRNKVYDGMMHSERTVKTSSFMQRGDKFPEFIKVPLKNTITGKVKYKYIRSYENNLYKVLSRYNDASSKTISTLAHAPEYVSKDLYYKDTGNVKNALNAIRAYEDSHYQSIFPWSRRGGQAPTERYLRDLIENNVLGVNGTHQSNLGIKAVGNFTNLIGLSSVFEPGFKNLGLGQVQSWIGHDSQFYINGVTNWFNKRDRKNSVLTAKELGAIGYTKKEFEGIQKIQTVLQKSYTWSSMEIAENFNRISDISATQLQFNFFAMELNGNYVTDREKNRIRDWFRNVARFSDKDMSLIESGKVFEKSEQGEIAFTHLMNKAAHYVHKSTQGGLGPLDLPKWMNRPNIRYMLTFMKIAAGITQFLIQGVLKPLAKGQVGPALKILLGSAAVSEGLRLTDRYIFNKVEPDLVLSLGDRIWQRVLDSEILALFGLIIEQIPAFNPYYKDKGTFNNLIEAAPPFASIVKSTVELAGGDISLEQWGKRHFQLYNQYDKWKNSKNTDVMAVKNALDIKRQYERNIGKHKGVAINNPNECQPHYYDLKHELLMNTKEEKLAEVYYDACNCVLNELMASPEVDITKPNAQYFVNKAHRTVMSSINKLNPKNINDDDKDMTHSQLKAMEMNVLKEGGKEALDILNKGGNIFSHRKNKILKIRTSPKYAKRYSDFFKEYTYKAK